METFTLVPEYPFEEAYQWGTVQSSSDFGHSQRRARWPRPKRRFNLAFQSLTRAEREYMISFFNNQKGAAGAFLYQLPDPLPSPDFPGTPGTTPGGTLGNRDYYYQITWTTTAGETLRSTQRVFALTNTNLFTLALPMFPTNVTSAKIYVSSTSNNQTLQATVTTSGATWTEPSTGLVSGAAPPATNTASEVVTVYLESDNIGPAKTTAGVYSGSLVFAEVL